MVLGKMRDTSELEGGEGITNPCPAPVPEVTNRNNSEPNWDEIATQNEATEQEYLEPPQFKVGDRVAHIDPKEIAFNWRGEIVRIYKNQFSEWMADVRWPERRKLKLKGDVVCTRLENLRRLD